MAPPAAVRESHRSRAAAAVAAAATVVRVSRWFSTLYTRWIVSPSGRPPLDSSVLATHVVLSIAAQYIVPSRISPDLCVQLSRTRASPFSRFPYTLVFSIIFSHHRIIFRYDDDTLRTRYPRSSLLGNPGPPSPTLAVRFEHRPRKTVSPSRRPYIYRIRRGHVRVLLLSAARSPI